MLECSTAGAACLADRFVLISGCSGGGKSTLIAGLARRGHPVVEEPGRRIVAEERAGDGTALPWVNASAFARRALEMARSDLILAAGMPGWVFFDRGLIDAAVALRHTAAVPLDESIGAARFHPTVFLAPPWQGIYRADRDRPHGFDDATAEYHRLADAYRALGYRLELLPKVSPEARADHILACLSG